MNDHLLFCLQLLLISASIARADFIFEFQIVRHVTNGDCFGIDLTIPCETFVNDFCLRGPSFQGLPRNDDRGNCPLGKNTERVFTTIPAFRDIRSSEPWPGSFQLFLGAHDDDYPFVTFDFLDNIYIDRSKTVGNSYSAEERIWGDRNKVAVDIRYRVRCVQNYYGADCNQYCRARDDDSSGHYTCNSVDGSKICRDGFEHPHSNCVDRITACSSSSPCQRGSCSSVGLTEFTCSCPPGYTGTTCELEIDECLNNTACLNGGNCTDLLADFSCECVPGFTGKDCDIDIDECLKVACVGNATCIHGINEYECACNPGFEGSNCTEIDPCERTPCAVTGECLSYSPFNYSCVCGPGYTGSLCEEDIDDCATGVSCPLNSVCVDALQAYSCNCLPGFTGPNCDERIAIVDDAGSAAATVGGAVGGIIVFIILLLIVIVCVVVFIAVARRRSKRQFSIPQNPYEMSPTPESPAHDVTNSLYSPSGDPLINNPLYTMSSGSSSIPSPERQQSSPGFDMSTSPAYGHVHDINNPLYGEMSPARATDPVYAELEGPSQKPQPKKGSENYPYSYADLQRRPTGGVPPIVPPPIAGPPHYEQQEKSRPQYEVVQLKPNSPQEELATHQYDVPKPVTSPPPSPYEVSVTSNNLAVVKEKIVKKKSIYDSDSDISVQPTPLPRTRPPKSTNDEYSYAMVDSARGGSVKIKEEVAGGQGDPPPYNQLEHNLGPDVTALTQVRLAAIDGSGYKALDND